jgi:[acyl-carrier-protein] S-malonyltransferase
MAEVAGRLAEAFESETWRDARVPVVSNVTAEPETDAGRIRALLAEQVRSPVEWVASIERLVRDGVDRAVELGPGSALVGMLRRIAPDMQAVAVGDTVGLTVAAEELDLRHAGASASW